MIKTRQCLDYLLISYSFLKSHHNIALEVFPDEN